MPKFTQIMHVALMVRVGNACVARNNLHIPPSSQSAF